MLAESSANPRGCVAPRRFEGGIWGEVHVKAGTKHTPEALEKLTRANRRNAERRRLRAARLPHHLRALQRQNANVHPDVAPIAEASRQEHDELLEALGGPDRVSPQRRAILEDLVGVGLVLRSELMRYALTRDPEAQARITSCANTRRQSLSALGLDRVATDVPRLDEYVAAQGGAGATFDVQPEEEVRDA